MAAEDLVDGLIVAKSEIDGDQVDDCKNSKRFFNNVLFFTFCSYSKKIVSGENFLLSDIVVVLIFNLVNV